MSIIENEKKYALEISAKLEYLIKTNRTKVDELADYIGITSVNFSRARNLMKKGKFPTCKFLVGISKFYEENFLT